MIPELPAAVPEIPVSDVVAAMEYYRDKLSFRIDWFEADIELAGISRDQRRLFLACPACREEWVKASPVLSLLTLYSIRAVVVQYNSWNTTKVTRVSMPDWKPLG